MTECIGCGTDRCPCHGRMQTLIDERDYNRLIIREMQAKLDKANGRITLEQMRERVAETAQARKNLMGAHMNTRAYTIEDWQDLVHEAWGVIANAGFTEGEEKTTGWHEAARRWRDKMHEMMQIKL